MFSQVLTSAYYLLSDLYVCDDFDGDQESPESSEESEISDDQTETESVN